MTTLTNLKVKLLQDDIPAWQIAAKVGIHPSTLSEYALGKKEIKAKHLRALAKYFKCPQRDILGTSEFVTEVSDGDSR
jgi:transcriptional regulator with XRE-family HTH domain